MKILITGASGYIGSKIYQELKSRGYDCIGIYNKTKLFDDLINVDLTNREDVVDFLTMQRPDVIIHAAADAHTQTCEATPAYAQSLNVDATDYLVQWSGENAARFIYLSTFACFNEHSTSVYPKTKQQAEKIVRGLVNYVILRLSLVVGLSPNKDSHNFYNDLIKDYKEAVSISADSSWEFELSYLANFVKFLLAIIENTHIKGEMIPYVDQGITSRYKLAKDLFSATSLEIKETTSNRIIPLPELDLSAYENYALPRGSYTQVIRSMQHELGLE